nr:hypothetical protein [Brucella inopinata]
MVSFAVGGNLDGLDPKRDTLANVDAYGRAVPSARYMGGREFDIMTDGLAMPQISDSARYRKQRFGATDHGAAVSRAGLRSIPNSNLRWINAGTASDEERYVAACIYAR